jgi:hypothetical protein
MAVDGAGNAYLAGVSFRDSTNDVLALKYTSAGTLEWATAWDSPWHHYDTGTACRLGPDGRLVVVGYCQKDTVIGAKDWVVLKLSPTGGIEWERFYDGPGQGEDIPAALAIGSDSSIYVTGFAVSAAGDTDCVTLKYSATGDLLWERGEDAGPGAEDVGNAVALDEAGGALYVAGTTLGADGVSSYLLLRYGLDGARDWMRLYTGPSADWNEAGLVAVRSGDLIVGGTSTGAGTELDYSVLRYSTAGSMLGNARFAGADSAADYPAALALEAGGDVYVTGTTMDTSGVDVVTLRLDINAATTSAPQRDGLPRALALGPCTPNPASGTAFVRVDLPREAVVTLVLCDVAGRAVQDLVGRARLGAGSHRVAFQAAGLPAGLYFLRLQADTGERETTLAGKVVIVR